MRCCSSYVRRSRLKMLWHTCLHSLYMLPKWVVNLVMAKDTGSSHLRDSGTPQPKTEREIPQGVTSQDSYMIVVVAMESSRGHSCLQKSMRGGWGQHYSTRHNASTTRILAPSSAQSIHIHYAISQTSAHGHKRPHNCCNYPVHNAVLCL